MIETIQIQGEDLRYFSLFMFFTIDVTFRIGLPFFKTSNYDYKKNPGSLGRGITRVLFNQLCKSNIVINLIYVNDFIEIYRVCHLALKYMNFKIDTNDLIKVQNMLL